MKTAEARWRESREQVAEISALGVSGLDWAPCGPGGDAAVVVEAVAAVNGAEFRFVGFRVQLPVDAGWTGDGGWNDDRTAQASGLVWDVERYRRFVRGMDDLPMGCDPKLIDALSDECEVDLDEDMARVEGLWTGLCGMIAKNGDGWLPAIIDGSPYLILGYPTGRPAPGGLLVDGGRRKRWPDQRPGEHHFPCTVEGMLAGMDTIEVRHLRAGGSDIMRPAVPTDRAAERLAGMRAVAEALPGYAGSGTVDIDGRRHFCLVTPVDVGHFEFDMARFHGALASGLRPGRGRFAVADPLAGIGRRLGAVVEGLAQAVRDGRVGRRGDDVLFVSSPRTLAGDLGFRRRGARRGDIERMLMEDLGSLVVRGVYRPHDEAPTMLMLDPLAKMAFISDGAVFVHLSTLFVHLAENSLPGEVGMVATDGSVLDVALPEERLVGGPSCLRTAPAVADGPLAAEIARRQDGD